MDERRRPEGRRAVDQVERRLARVADHTSHGVVLTDARGRIEWVNEGFTRLTGWTLGEVAGRTPGEVLQGPGTDPQTVSAMAESLHRGEGFTVEILNFDRQGRRRWLDIEVQPIREDSGELTHYMALQSDVTARRTAEERLRATSMLLITLIENLPMGVLVEDEHGNVLHINGMLLRMFNLPASPEEVLRAGDAWFERQARARCLDPDAFDRGLTVARDRRRVLLGQEMRMADGRTFERDSVPFLAADGRTGRLWLYRDVTEGRASADALAQAREREVEIGARIQQMLLVGRPPRDLEGATIAAVSRPSQRVDGDFFDVFRHGATLFDVLVGDVMGKGVPAALLGAALKSVFLRTQATLCRRSRLPAPEEIVAAVHGEVASQLARLESFATLAYARFDLSRRRVELVDCGHARTVRWKARTATCELLEGENLPLGVTEAETYQSLAVGIEPGDVFLFYSDGVTEAHDATGEMYGLARLLDLICREAPEGPDALVAAVLREVEAFSGDSGPGDDLTCVAVRIGLAGPRECEGIELAASNEELDRLREFVTTFCAERGPEGFELADADALVLAVNEAASNVVRHAYDGGGPGDSFRAEALAFPDRIEVVLSHRGAPFDPGSWPPDPVFDGSRESGFGLYIMRRSVDHLSFETDGGGHRVRLVKAVRSPATEVARAGSFPGAEGAHGGRPVETNEGIAMDMIVEQQGNVHVVMVPGDNLDAGNSRDFRQGIQPVLDNNPRLVFDMSKLRFVDSSGLGAILSALRQANARGGDLRLCAMTKPVRALFELVRMHRVFGIYNTRDEAVRSFQEEH